LIHSSAPIGDTVRLRSCLSSQQLLFRRTVLSKQSALGLEEIVASAQRNPPWDKAEIILALDLYFNHESDTKHGSTEEIEELSSTLRKLSFHEEIPNPEKFRNYAGVGLKLGNLQYLDPHEPGKGMKGASHLDKEVWDEYHDDPKTLHQIALEIRASIDDTDSRAALASADVEEDEGSFPEGKFIYRIHRVRERNNKAVEAAKRAALRDGNLHCSICGFDFERQYGLRGTGYIEFHHVKPISEYEPGEETKPSDLIPVCANCHRMLHRGKPWITPDELRTLVKNTFSSYF
jgi:5-methylcytosine-specific restriction protein A